MYKRAGSIHLRVKKLNERVGGNRSRWQIYFEFDSIPRKARKMQHAKNAKQESNNVIFASITPILIRIKQNNRKVLNSKLRTQNLELRT